MDAHDATSSTPDPAPAATSRGFGMALFAVVGLLAGALLTPLLQGFFDGPHCATCAPRGDPRLLALPLPLFAAACASAWAGLLHPGPGAVRYGAGRGLGIALLAYLCFSMAVSLYVQATVQPHTGLLGRFETGYYLLLGFVFTPFPWAVLAMGAATGCLSLPATRAAGRRALRALGRAARRVATPLRDGLADIDARAAAPGFRPALVVIVSSALLLAGTTLGFVVAREGPAASGQHDDPSVLLFPATFALIVGAVGWAGGRLAAARLPAHRRGPLLIASAVAALAGAVVFACRVA
jgi:hypothetical protein